MSISETSWSRSYSWSWSWSWSRLESADALRTVSLPSVDIILFSSACHCALAGGEGIDGSFRPDDEGACSIVGSSADRELE